jgi:membrane-associated PAP2 superfamily phosphatase
MQAMQDLPPQYLTRLPARRTLLAVTLACLPVLVLWDMSGADVAMMHWWGDTKGFALQEHWFLTRVLHKGLHDAAIVLLLALLVGIWWPWGSLKALTRSQRALLPIGVACASLAVSALKAASLTSCPWDLQMFGGVARYVSHWQWGIADGGPGRCFPAGHASGGFAFLIGHLVFKDTAPRVAQVWLVAALVAGTLMGLGQMARGAHFASHTLWSAYVCWCVVLLVDAVGRWYIKRPGKS